MRLGRTIAAIAITALSLTACSGNDSSNAKAGSAPSTDSSPAEEAVGLPAEPDSAQRAALLVGLKAIELMLVTDEDETIDKARNQCATITDGGADADAAAKRRFSTSELEVTDDQAKAINRVLKAALCPGF